MENLNMNMIVSFLIICSVIASSQCTLRKPLNGTFISKRLKSGPIFLVDSRTILVTQFTYISSRTKTALKIHDKWFKAILRSGDVRTIPINLEFLDDKNAALTEDSYLGINMYLRVPIQSEFNVRHFAAIAFMNDKDEVKASVPIKPDDLFGLPDSDNQDPSYKNGKFIFVYPKCCPVDNYLVNDVCVRMSVKLHIRFPIHQKVGKQYESEPMSTESFIYEPYVFPSSCIRVKFDNKDNAILLSDLELLIPEEPMSQLVCMDSDFDNDTQLFQENVYVCQENLINGNVNMASIFRNHASGYHDNVRLMWMSVIFLYFYYMIL